MLPMSALLRRFVHSTFAIGLAFAVAASLCSIAVAAQPTGDFHQAESQPRTPSTDAAPVSNQSRPADTTESFKEYGNPLPFSGWKVINLPTDRTVSSGNWLFLISHRFNRPVNAGYAGFFGLDTGATMYLSLGYAVTDNLLVALARSDADDNVELETRYRLLDERTSAPVGMSLQGSMNWLTVDRPNERRWRGQAFKFTGQATVTRTIADQLGLAIVPGVTVNPNEDFSSEAPLLSLGLGARWKVEKKTAVVAEWTPILSRSDRTVTDANRYATWSAGLELTTGGHVFQIVVGNNAGLATDHYLRGTDLAPGDIYKGDVRLGFNIFRILDFSKF